MSGLLGIWNLDGAPVSQKILDLMSARLAHRGPNGVTSVLLDCMGLAYQSMCVTPDSLREIQPFRCASTWVLWDGRLDNRDELFSLLHPRAEIASNDPDVVLVAAAYREWRESFAAKLDGDFALAVFDSASQHLFLARDTLGARTLHYCRFGNTFLFASEAKSLIAHPAVSTAPNDEALAEWLFRIPDSTDETRTFFRNIAAVPHGGLVTVTPDKTSWRRHWDFDPGRELRLRDHREYVERYRATFARAVRNRMRTSYPMTATVSGGLDSSAIFCSMLKIAGQENESLAPITAMAFASDHPQADERAHRRALEDQWGIKILEIPFPSARMMSATAPLEDTWHSEGPYSKWAVWRTFLERSVEAGARVSFGGYFGDQLLTHPHYLLDLLRNLKLLAFCKHLKASYSWWDTGTFGLWSQHLYVTLKGHLMPDGLRPLYHRLVRPWRRTVTEIPWLSKDFFALAKDLEKSRSLLQAPPCANHSRVLYHMVRSRQLCLRNDLEVRSEARYPCQTVYPYRDRSLISFLMSVPGEEVYRAGCRGFQREAAVGLLPEMIRTRRNKAGFNGPGSVGAREDLESAENTLADGLAMSLGFLAPKAELSRRLDHLRRLLHQGNNGLSIWWVYDLVSLENWLQAFFSGRMPGRHDNLPVQRLPVLSGKK